MTLRNRILISIVGGILCAVLLVGAISAYRVNRDFASYLKVDQQARTNRILQNIAQIYQSDSSLNLEEIESYSRREGIYIEIFDRHQKSLKQFDGIPGNAVMSGNYVEKEVPILGAFQQIVGSIRVGYWDNSLISQSARSFSQSMYVSVLSAVLFAGVFSFIASFWISRRITKPVEAIITQTNRIRNGDYSHKPDPEGFAREFDQLTNNINLLSDTLETQEGYRKKYAQDIAHELRTPVTALKLQISAMRDKIIQPDDENLTIALDEINRLNRMIEMLKSSFQNEEGWAEIHVESVNLSAFIENIAVSIRPLLSADHVRLQLNVPKQAVLETDPERLRRILYNLISNAKKSVNEQGLITIQVRQNKKNTTIEVRDNGIGIRRKDLPHIFDRFYRADIARNTKQGGTGLGLAIVKSFVSSLNGTIEVETELGVGTAFAIILPTGWPNNSDPKENEG